MIHGTQVTVLSKTKTGVDDMNMPVFEETQTVVDDVLVGWFPLMIRLAVCVGLGIVLRLLFIFRKPLLLRCVGVMWNSWGRFGGFKVIRNRTW